MKRLGAVLLADVAGYSKMMSYDEPGTLQKIKQFSEQILRPLLEKYKGKLVKGLGDGWLLEFNSASESVEFGQHVQRALNENKFFDLRIGIHVGDVEHTENDIFGDAVNIAARLESVAEIGQLAISSSTYICLDQSIAKSFKNCGSHQLKNISTPIEIWSTGGINLSSKGLNASARDSSKKYVCVVPFDNPGGDAGHYAKELTARLEVDLNAKDWINSIVQSTPIPEDFVVTGRIDVSGSNAVTDLQLNAPGGKNLWSYRMAANMSNISALATSMSAQMSNQILMEIMKVRGKY